MELYKLYQMSVNERTIKQGRIRLCRWNSTLQMSPASYEIKTNELMNRWNSTLLESSLEFENWKRISLRNITERDYELGSAIQKP
jgi:hypothetical protein